MEQEALEGPRPARGDPPRPLARLTWATVLLALVATAWSAYENDWTTDEPMHLEWSQRLLEQRITERRSKLHYNSKTPVTLLNEAARRVARRTLDIRDPRLVRFATRAPGLLWLGVVLAATFLLARRCANSWAAHLATIAVALDPNLIANSSIATVDTAYAAATLLTVAASLGFAARPGVGRGTLLGLALGLAFSVKFTAFLLLPGVLLLPLAAPGGAGRLRSSLRAVMVGALAAFATALIVISASYLFTEVGVPLREVAWKSPALLFLAEAAPGLALPLPVDFLTGLDILLSSERSKEYDVVVLGRRHPSGVFYYFAVAWLLKTPVLVLGGLAYGVGRGLHTRFLLAAPALRYVALHLLIGLTYFSFVFRMQIGYRFVLMCVPLLAILAAAGLAAPPRSPRLSQGLLAVVLCAGAENAAYLGNSLAFTNAAVWPKRRVFRLLADSNVDYGQNHEKMARWAAENPGPNRHLNPVHLLPGENILSFDQATSARGFPRHEWLREHLDPVRHFRHTYLFFEASEAQFERFLTEARRLVPSAVAGALCLPSVRGERTYDLQAEAAFSEDLLPAEAHLLCVTLSAPADLALRGERGEVTWGVAERPRREWDRLRGGQQAWYRLEPGVHAFVAARPNGFRGEWTARGGPLTASIRRVRVRGDGVVRAVGKG